MWSQQDTCFYYIPNNFNPTTKLAIFDFDDTLVEAFKTNILPRVPETLQALSNSGYTLVIVSNQKGIKKKKATHQSVRRRFGDFISAVGIPRIAVFYSTDDDKYRKPHTGMFHLMKEVLGLRGRRNIGKTSFYCGDAAGRPKTKDRKRDFSNSDMLFAYNSGLRFYVPEEIFGEGKYADTGRLGVPMEAEPHSHKIQKKNFAIKIDESRLGECPLVIMMIGPPGSGKSSIATTLLKKHPTLEYLSMDAGLTKAKIVKVVKKLVSERKSFIIDNTHPSVASRGTFLSEITDEYKKMAIWFDIPKDLSEHMTQARIELGGRHVPKVALNIYYSKFQAPTSQEFSGGILKLSGVFGHTKEFLDAFSKRYI